MRFYRTRIRVETDGEERTIEEWYLPLSFASKACTESAFDGDRLIEAIVDRVEFDPNRRNILAILRGDFVDATVVRMWPEENRREKVQIS